MRLGMESEWICGLDQNRIGELLQSVSLKI